MTKDQKARDLTRESFDTSTVAGYARFLTWVVWRDHYQDVSPDFEIFGNDLFMMTQLDNMLTGGASDRYKTAYMEWSRKTEWARGLGGAKSLGKHLADVMREEIERLRQYERGVTATVGKSLLRPPISAANPLPPGCNCEPGRCAAPVISGRQTPCRDPEKARTESGPCDDCPGAQFCDYPECRRANRG